MSNLQNNINKTTEIELRTPQQGSFANPGESSGRTYVEIVGETASLVTSFVRSLGNETQNGDAPEPLKHAGPLNEIVKYLPWNDTISLLQTCKTIRNALNTKVLLKNIQVVLNM